MVENSWPKSDAETADGPRPGSFGSHPVRRLSTEMVVESALATVAATTAPPSSVNSATVPAMTFDLRPMTFSTARR